MLTFVQTNVVSSDLRLLELLIIGKEVYSSSVRSASIVGRGCGCIARGEASLNSV